MKTLTGETYVEPAMEFQCTDLVIYYTLCDELGSDVKTRDWSYDD